jgi:uncharacterized ParB-like nuclease family protein
MSKKINFENWQNYGLNNVQTYMLIDINDIVVYYGDATYGMVATSNHLREGLNSRTPNKPIDVLWLMEENKFFITDGCHRYAQSVIDNKKQILCRVDWSGYSLLYSIPKINERFSIKEHKHKIFGKF